MAHQQYSTAGEGFPLLTDAVSNASVPLFVENLLRGEKPRAEWMCGVEFELFGYDRARSFERIDAEQVERVLAGFAPSSNDLVHEGGTLVEVNDGQMNRLTVEPGGQVDLDLRQLGVAYVRVVPDRSGLLRVDHLQRDRPHRRHGGELDQALGLGVAQARRDACERVAKTRSIKRVVYVSCDRGTLARDADILASAFAPLRLRGLVAAVSCCPPALSRSRRDRLDRSWRSSR